MPERRPTSTTGQRTHRYLRLSLAFAVLAIGIAVAVQVFWAGEPLLPSISAYFYSSARNVFVGALIGTALALLALSGRGAETVLLNIAAIFAPLIAIVPTGYEDTGALPPGYLAGVHNGVITYAIIVGLVLVVALILVITREVAILGTVIAGLTATIVTAALLLFSFVPPLNEGFPFNTVLPISVHYIVTIAFFAAFILVPIVNAWPRKREAGEEELGVVYRVIYAAIPLLMIMDIVLMLVLAPRHPERPVIFWGEAGALFLFAVFWVTQTIERWGQEDQRGVAWTRLHTSR